MHVNCHKKFLPILSTVSHRCIARFSECKFCNSSLATTQPGNIAMREVVGKEECSAFSTESSLDSFTNRLVRQQVEKWKSPNTKMWKTLKSRQHVAHQSYQQEDKPRKECSRCLNYSENEKEKSGDIRSFLHNCYEIKMIPDTLLSQMFVQQDDIETILMIKNIRSVVDSQEYKEQAFYDVCLAEAMWRNEHFENALDLFWKFYVKNIHLRRKIKSMLEILFADAISKKGEAVLVLIINFSKTFVDTYSDYTLLSYVWEYCFLSEWHSDNEIAANLLEEFHEMRNVIQLKARDITNISLIYNKVNIVHRLFEALLKYEMKTEYELVLRTLFDYACSVRDLYACSAIVQSCYELNVTLTEVQNARFLTVFCQRDVPHDVKLPIKTWSIKPRKFTFKF